MTEPDDECRHLLVQNKLVSQVCFLLNLAVFDYRGKGSKTTFLETLN